MTSEPHFIMDSLESFASERSNIAYTTHSHDIFRSFDIYFGEEDKQHRPPLICFVHGGAWRR
jgi:acetyl esterase/lipase